VSRKFAKESFDEEILIARQSFLQYIYPLFDKSSFLLSSSKISLPIQLHHKLLPRGIKLIGHTIKLCIKVIKHRLREETFAFKKI